MKSKVPLHCKKRFFGEVNPSEKTTNNVIYMKKLVQARIIKKTRSKFHIST